MSVYVDDMKAQLGRMVMCHMIADTRAELLLMAGKIGVASRWIQYPHTHREHFDICKSKRASALRQGAIAISRRELVAKISARKDQCVESAGKHVSQEVSVAGVQQPGGRIAGEVLQHSMPHEGLQGAASEDRGRS